MSSSPELAPWDVQHFWHPFTQMAEYQPLVIQRAEGVWLYDTEDRRYLDGISSMWCNLLGHRHPALDEAIRRQLDQAAHTTALGLAHPAAIRLAHRLAELAPGNLDHVFLGSDGSSAVEAALKIAFQYWRQCPEPQPTKTKFLALGEAYHGDTIGSASLGGIDRFTGVFQPLFFEVLRLPIPDEHSLPPGAGPEYFLNQLQQVLAGQHGEIAALVLEPRIQAAAGMRFHPEGYLRGVRELTRRFQVLLIADEIVTGCGRLGPLFACDLEGVVPDILCLGKSLTGGYLPLSATIVSPEIYQAFLGDYASGRAFRHGHTYAGNPLGCAAALATLDVVTGQKFQAGLQKQFARLAELLENLHGQAHVATTRQLGLIAAAELTPTSNPNDRYGPELRMGHEICLAAKERGVWLRPLGDTLVVMPPLVISEEELRFLMRVLGESIAEVTGE